MKKAFNIFLVLALCLFVTGCAMNSDTQSDLWSTAKYTQDTSFGDGAKTLDITVEAGDKSAVFTIKSDKTTVGEALMEHELVTGEQGPYGLYIKSVNGIVADYNIDKSYWSFNKQGEYMTTGVDTTEFVDGDKFELVYTK